MRKGDRKESKRAQYLKIIKKASKDFKLFTQIIGEIKIGKHQKRWIEVCQEISDNPFGGQQYIIVAPPGGGKALSNDTPVLTNQGWKNHGDLKTGDKVFNSKGKFVKVEATSSIFSDRKAYRVFFSDKSYIDADEAHEWNVYCDRESYRGWKPGDRKPHRKLETLETKDLLIGQRRPPALPVVEPLDTPKIELPINPYILGAWLGDGNKDYPIITYAYKDSQMIEEIESEGAVKKISSSNENSGRFTFTDEKQFTRNYMLSKFKKLNILYNKHIPDIYLLGSIEQRLSLLQGLMDTDGSADKDGGCEFTNTNKRLIEGVHNLLSTLGIKNRITLGNIW